MPDKITNKDVKAMLTDLVKKLNDGTVRVDVNKMDKGDYASTSIVIPSQYPFGDVDKELEVNQAKLTALHTVIARAIGIPGRMEGDFAPNTNENPVTAATFAYGTVDPKKRTSEEILTAFKQESERLLSLTGKDFDMAVAQVKAVYKELDKQDLQHEKEAKVKSQSVPNVAAPDDRYLY